MQAFPQKQEPSASRFETLARIAMAAILIAPAVAALTITSLIHGGAPATAQSSAQPVLAQLTVPLPGPLDAGEVGPFAFGFLVFDWDPSAPGGVPGFDNWPVGRQPR